MQSYAQELTGIYPNDGYLSSADHNSNNGDDSANLYFESVLPSVHHGRELGDHVQMHIDSSASSAGSSPERGDSGKRSRSLSLNTKNVQYRSTAHVTQQQINKKRQRATPEQLNVLEDAFACNPSPNARMRETISTQINMTERSVQIWFQNRRAKIKLLHKKCGPDEVVDQTSSTVRPGFPERSYSIDPGLFQDHSGAIMEDYQDASIGSITKLNCRSLTIGTWRRVACTSNDLICYFSDDELKFTYYINSGSTGFQIEFPFSSILKIDLNHKSTPSTNEMGRAIISLSSCPIFFMELNCPGAWKQCTDFTENQQGTSVLHHTIVGPYQHLKSSLMHLAVFHEEINTKISFDDAQPFGLTEAISHEAVNFTGRHSELYSPQGNRIYERSSLMPHMAEKKRDSTRHAHRRTRSRSAPITVDFSWLTHGHSMGSSGYNHGQQSLSMSQRPPPEQVPSTASQPLSLDCSDGFFTPQAATPSCYPDTWYASSYANTPLLDTDCSQLGSPMVPGGAPFDLPLATSQLDPYTSFADMGNVTSTTMHNLSDHQSSFNQSMPDLSQLESVPEMPIANQQEYPVADSFQALLGAPCLVPMGYSQETNQLPPV